MERKIGETFEFKGKTYEVAELPDFVIQKKNAIAKGVIQKMQQELVAQATEWIPVTCVSKKLKKIWKSKTIIN